MLVLYCNAVGSIASVETKRLPLTRDCEEYDVPEAVPSTPNELPNTRTVPPAPAAPPAPAPTCCTLPPPPAASTGPLIVIAPGVDMVTSPALPPGKGPTCDVPWSPEEVSWRPPAPPPPELLM